MQRIFGLILILAGCTGLGMWYSMQFRLRIYNLKQMCHILSMLESQVRFGRCTMGECCAQIARRVNDPFQSSLQEIAQEMKQNAGSSLGQVSGISFERHLKKLVVSKREKEEQELFGKKIYELDEVNKIQSVVLVAVKYNDMKADMDLLKEKGFVNLIQGFQFWIED